MSNKLYWGLGILIVLLIGAFVFVMDKNQIAKDQSENRQLETDLAEGQKKSEAHNRAANTPKVIDISEIQQLETELIEVQKKIEVHNKAANTPNVVDISDVKPPTAATGFKWVRHGNHWDKVKVTETEPQMSISKSPLTYHAELLETYPVEALRLQSEERGHWSAKWIPPFPPENQEAAAIAMSYYLIIYYRSTEQTDTAVYQKLVDKTFELNNAIMEHPVGAYRYDLLNLTTPVLRKNNVGVGVGPSNYSLPRK